MTMTTVCPPSHNNELLKIIFQWGFSCYMYFLIYTSAEVTKNVTLQQKGFGHFFLATFSCFTGNAIASQIIIYTLLFPSCLLRGRHSKLLVSINNLCDIKSSIKYSLSYASKQNASQNKDQKEERSPTLIMLTFLYFPTQKLQWHFTLIIWELFLAPLKSENYRNFQGTNSWRRLWKKNLSVKLGINLKDFFFNKEKILKEE